MDKLFESQVSITPDAIAVSFEEQQWTYRELNAKANQLANYLKKRGVAPEVLVGICAERSLDMVVGILGILKAGGAYVPLDPAYPKERLAFILEETKVPLLLTQSHLFDVLPQSEASVIYLDKEWETIAQESEQTPPSQVTPQNLAYIMYTSGSTGKPKGVQMPRASVQQYLQAITQVLPIQPDDVYLHVASFSFSSSVRQLMLPLSQGAKVILATRDQTKNPLSLFKLIQKQGVTVFDGVASVWRYGLLALENLDRTHTEALLKSKLRFIVLSGELTSCQVYKKLRDLFQDKVRFVNLYGQTETIGSCAYAVPEEFNGEQGYLPVGYPYPHNKTYILDEHLQPVPTGEIGELHMAGGCLARGYLNRPDLNASRFIDNPFVQADSSEYQSFGRLFKTGDLARYLPDDIIEVVGRVDFQVKLRGLRVELGEIESALEQYPSIKQAVVIAREDTSGEKRLVAYGIPELPSDEINQTALSKKLRHFLEQKLPDYMVPSTFVFLDSLPLTSNGKLDRLSLSAPHQESSLEKPSPATPTDDLEVQLLQIWEKLLGVKGIGTQDNFFELGGHSLLAAQLFSEVEKISGKKLSLAALSQAPTIEELANLLAKDEQLIPESTLLEIQRGGSRIPLFGVHVLGDGFHFYRPLITHLDPEQPVYGLASQSLGIAQRFLNRVEDMAAHYIKDMRAFKPEGPYCLAGVSFGGLVAYEMARQLHAQGQEVALLALFDTPGPDHRKQLSIPQRILGHGINFLHLGPAYMLNKVKKQRYNPTEILQVNYAKSNSTNEALSDDDLRRLEILRENQEAKKYYAIPPYPGKVTLFRSLEHPDNLLPYHFLDPQLGWSRAAIGGLDIYDIPGDHLGILQEPNVRVLAKKLKACLDRVQVKETVQG
ncbi:MAG: amino acid adenylation domain-containing protein [Coleofasciculus sp. S288]|nr:amino acid adenylation domain-containing protein [Coleofasciculus sp. S288]